MPRAPRKQLRELAARFKEGYELERSGSDHYHVVDPQGEKVLLDGKVLALAGTPARGGRTFANAEAQLRQAGVLRENGQSQPRVRDEVKDRRKAALRTMIEARQKQRQLEANALHNRLEKVLKPMGGFEAEGMQADLSHVAVIIAREQGNTRFSPDLLHSSVFRIAHRGWVVPEYQEVWNALAEHLEQAKDPVDEWFRLVRQARGLPETIVEQLPLVEGEWPFRVELLPLSGLTVDHRYQRPVPWPFVRKMAASFDPSLVGTIDVAERRRGAVYAVLDGQLRLEAMRMLGRQTVWASIYGGLDLPAEARFFLHKNRDRKVIHPYYTFKARVTAGDEDATETEKIVERHGYKLAIGAPKPGTSLQDNISAVSAVEYAYKLRRPDGTPALEPTLELLAKMTRGKQHGQNNILIRGLARVFTAFDDETLDRERLERVFDDYSPTYLLGRARDRSISGRYGGSAEQHMARTIVEEYNRTGRGRKLKLPY